MSRFLRLPGPLLLLLFLTAVAAYPTDAVRAAVASIVQASGARRCSLAELGERLRETGIVLPEGTSLQNFVAQDDELLLSGPPSHRKVGLAAGTTQAALVERVSAVLRLHGPMTSAELQLRLRAERQRVPGLLSLLRSHSSIFAVHEGIVTLVDAGATPRGDAAVTAAAPLVRLRALSLPDDMDESRLAPLGSLRDVIVLDLDNQAFVALERAAEYAAGDAGVFVVAASSRANNPRVPQRVASQLERVAAAGRLRLLAPRRDVPNGADFVLAFWVGWLHSRLAEGARFVLVSQDVSLEQTLADLLGGAGSCGRDVETNPQFLDPSC